ncbi:tetratricopeptide repeat protein [Streptomyces sanyensis]
MKSETLRKTVAGVLGGAAALTLVVLLVPGWGDGGGGSPREAAGRALSAAAAGAPAAADDLAALIAEHERRVRESPGDDRAWARLGAAYVERGVGSGETALFPKAERALRRSLALRAPDRGNAAALVGLGALANARNDFGAAREFGERARALRPGSWAVYPVLVDAYGGLGDPEAAGRAVDALRGLASGPQVEGRHAQAFRDRGLREDAAVLAHDARVHATTRAERAAARHRQGELAWEHGEYAEAVAHYEAALEADPGAHRSLGGRARSLAALGRTEEARQDYARVLERRPLPGYALEWGELEESLGERDRARSLFGRMRELVARGRRDGVDGDVVLARYEADHGAPEAAVHRLRDQWRRGHRSAEVADALGWALYRAGSPEEAVPFASRAAGQDAGGALFSYHRGVIALALGERGEARRHLVEALRRGPEFSPLRAPRARAALSAVAEPEPGGPKDLYGDGPDPIDEPEPSDEDGADGDGREDGADGDGANEGREDGAEEDGREDGSGEDGAEEDGREDGAEEDGREDGAEER